MVVDVVNRDDNNEQNRVQNARSRKKKFKITIEMKRDSNTII